jgi:hypothetical protein
MSRDGSTEYVVGGNISGMQGVCRREGVECCELKLGDDCSFLVWVEFEREAGCGMWMGDLQVQPELMAADSVRMEVDGGDDSAMPLLDNFDSLESKVVFLGMAWCVQMLGLWGGGCFGPGMGEELYLFDKNAVDVH